MITEKDYNTEGVYEQVVKHMLENNGMTTNPRVKDALGIPARNAFNILTKMKIAGFITTINTGVYVLLPPDSNRKLTNRGKQGVRIPTPGFRIVELTDKRHPTPTGSRQPIMTCERGSAVAHTLHI